MGSSFCPSVRPSFCGLTLASQYYRHSHTLWRIREKLPIPILIALKMVRKIRVFISHPKKTFLIHFIYATFQNLTFNTALRKVNALLKYSSCILEISMRTPEWAVIFRCCRTGLFRSDRGPQIRKNLYLNKLLALNRHQLHCPTPIFFLM